MNTEVYMEHGDTVLLPRPIAISKRPDECKHNRFLTCVAEKQDDGTIHLSEDPKGLLLLCTLCGSIRTLGEEWVSPAEHR